MRNFLELNLVDKLRYGYIIKGITFGTYSINRDRANGYIWPLGRVAFDNLRLKNSTVD
ncbi:MAG: hypothetical protein ACXAAH_17380 [Promethearchaeota archaeon]|jgi:hypothetical protein